MSMMEYFPEETIEALRAQREQLTARVKELEAEAKHWKQHSYTQESTIAALEQQLNDEKGICEALRSQNSDAVEEVQKLEQQIQQAEKRGYELAMDYGRTRFRCTQCEAEGMYIESDDKSYEQACAERDGGKK